MTTHPMPPIPSMPDSASRVKRPPQALINNAHRQGRLTPQASPGNTTTNSGQAPNPNNHTAITITATRPGQPKSQNGQPPLDTHRPFMDDNQPPFIETFPRWWDDLWWSRLGISAIGTRVAITGRVDELVAGPRVDAGATARRQCHSAYAGGQRSCRGARCRRGCHRAIRCCAG
jgi:hypothetical protein